VAEILTTREVFKVTSLDSDQDDEDSPGLDLERVKDEKYTTFHLPVEDRIVLETAMNKLKLIEQKVIREFYYSGLNQTEIAKKLGISCNYVSHLLRSGTRKLRRVLTTEELKEIQMQLQLANRHLDSAKSSYEPMIVDTLTGVYTEDYLYERLEEEITRAIRADSEVAFAVFMTKGIENFKAKYGTLRYDDLICTLADVIRANVRRCDVVGRLSEAEFATILLYTNGRAEQIAKRVSEAITHALGTSANLRSTSEVSLKFGVAVYPLDGANAEKLICTARERAGISAGKHIKKAA
jgi:diguanylate cyclase (GGDEF)-like protein